jgi:hypothetical protein
MEPRREERQKVVGSSAELKPRRFRIVKLEERIAPGQVKTNDVCYTQKHCATWQFWCSGVCW